MQQSSLAATLGRAPLFLLLQTNLLQFCRRLQALRRRSWILTVIIALFLLGYLGGSFWVFLEGLRFLGTFPGLGPVLVERLLYLLFACLFGLLLLSNLVIGYSTFFRNAEAAFLLSLPLRWETIFQWKFLESAILASWGFLFLIAPMLAAFGISRGESWSFYGLALGMLALFIVLPALGGAWLALLLARCLNRRLFRVGLLLIALLLLVRTLLWWLASMTADASSELRVLPMLDSLLVHTRLAQAPFLPSYWLATGLLRWSEGAVQETGFFLLVLLSYVLFFGFVTFTRLGRIFFNTSMAVQDRIGDTRFWPWQRRRPGATSPQPPRPGPVERLFALLEGLPPDLRAILVKDTLTFWRDTAQWGQTVLLVGLLALYVLNLHHFTEHLTSPFWIHMVAFLNLGTCSLCLATLSTRFVFPQFSLEGQRLWIVGLSPLGLKRLVWAKYGLGCAVSLGVTLALMILSCCLLELTGGWMLLFCVVITIMAFALNGLAMGLGVLFPNFGDSNPTKIVSGFGGTLCLVLSFLYILGSVLLLGSGTSSTLLGKGWIPKSEHALLFLLLSLAAGFFPLRLALRRLKTLEL